MIVDCCDNCQFCLKPFSRPAVSFPVSDRFNELCQYGPKGGRKREGVDTSFD